MIFFLLVCFVFGVKEDGCSLVAWKRIASYDEAIQCYMNFALVDEIKDSTIETLRKSVPLLALPASESRLLEKNLKWIGRRSFDSEFQFHMQLLKAFSRFQVKYDGGCFNKFRFHAPIELVVYEEDGEMVVRVANLTSHSVDLTMQWLQVGFDPFAFRGRKVVKIDSIPAYSYLQQLVRRHGLTGLNEALSRGAFIDGAWQVLPGAFSSNTIPTGKGTVEFEFEDQSIVKAPILVSIPPGFSDSYSFYTNMCLKDFKWVLPNESPSRYPSPALPEHFNVVLKTFHTKAVAVISRFLDFPGWEKDVARIFSGLNASELLIDLRDSSGLHVCGSSHILDYLFPGKLNSTFPLTFPDVPLVHKLLKECRDSKDACGELGFASALTCEPIPFYHRAPFNPSHIKVVKNGICSGGCAALLQGLLEAGVTKVYFVGPTPSIPLVNTGIPYSLKQLRRDLFRSRLGFDESTPPSFLTTADLHFSFGKFSRLDRISPIILNDPSFLYNATYLWYHILQI